MEYGVWWCQYNNNGNNNNNNNNNNDNDNILYNNIIEDLAVHSDDEQEPSNIKKVEALPRSDLIQSVLDQVKHINEKAVMTLIEPSEK